MPNAQTIQDFATPPSRVALLADDPRLIDRRQALEAEGFVVDVLPDFKDDERFAAQGYAVCVISGLERALASQGLIAAVTRREKATAFLGIVEALPRARRQTLMEAGLSEIMASNASLFELTTRVHALILKRAPIRALVVENDPQIAASLRRFLEEAGYSCSVAVDLREAQEAFARIPIDVLLLDRMLPDGDGLNFLERLRKRGVRTPALVLTTWNEPVQHVQALKAGADDYMAKSFDKEELLARIKVLLRPRNEDGRFAYGPLEILKKERIARWRGAPIQLSPRLFRLFVYFVERHSLTLTSSMLHADVWETSHQFNEMGIIAIGVRKLRCALEEAGLPEVIFREKNGYRFNLEKLLEGEHA